MKTQKDLILPKIPANLDPSMQRFCDDLLKVVAGLNKSIHNDLKDLAIPTKKTGGVRDAVASKPDKPIVGTIYFDDDTDTLGVCTGFDTYDAPIWKYASLT